jgi:CHASE3 domain sensor protein
LRHREEDERNSRCRTALVLGAPANAEENMPQVENGRISESTTEARAAVTGHNVRYVLLIGTLAVIVLLAIVYFVVKG